MIKFLMSRRLSALLLFAALALLQIQSALAACMDGDKAAPGSAMTCCDTGSGFTSEAFVDDAMPAELCERFCFRPSAPQSKTGNNAAPHNIPAWLSDRPVVAYAPMQSAPGSRWFLHDPPVTRQLIYHLQRLLI